MKKEKPKYLPKKEEKAEENGHKKKENNKQESKVKEKKEPVDDRDSRKKKQYRSKEGLGVIRLSDIDRHPEEFVSLRVCVDTKSIIDKKKYNLVKVADESGSAYIEMTKGVELSEDNWYDLVDFVVYGDRKYGYVAAQEGYLCGYAVSRRCCRWGSWRDGRRGGKP